MEEAEEGRSGEYWGGLERGVTAREVQGYASDIADLYWEFRFASLKRPARK